MYILIKIFYLSSLCILCVDKNSYSVLVTYSYYDSKYVFSLGEVRNHSTKYTRILHKNVTVKQF